jgi:hypothetical protein
MKQASPVGINDSEWEQEIQENKKKNRNVIDLDALKIKSKIGPILPRRMPLTVSSNPFMSITPSKPFIQQGLVELGLSQVL